MNIIARVLRLVFLVVVSGTVLGACTSAHFTALSDRGLQDLKLKSKFTVARSAQWRLASDTQISLVVPQDSKPVKRKRSAFALNESLHNELLKAFPATSHLGPVTALDAALALSLQQGKQVLVWPLLGEIGDNLNSYAELSEGRALYPDKSVEPDRVAFRILMYDVRSGKLLDNAQVIARGRMFAPDNSGPLNLYAEAVGTYVGVIAGHAPRIAHD